jgi:hypothetical protein
MLRERFGCWLTRAAAGLGAVAAVKYNQSFLDAGMQDLIFQL